MNRICKTCNIELDENIYSKKRTVCISCHNKNRRKKNINTLFRNQQPKIDKINSNNGNNPNISGYENHGYLVIGPRNIGKTYYMLKVLEKIGNKRPNHLITRSPSHYPNYKTSNEFKPIYK